jgi:hypothetical protein
VWREYVAKFTLDELFKPDQIVPPPPVQIPEPVEEEIDPLSQPIQVGANQSTIQNGILSMLREMNKLMDRTIKWLDKTQNTEIKSPILEIPAAAGHSKGEPQKKTALQVVNDMVRARLTQAEVDVFDDHGVRGVGTISSPEFKLLQSRGLKVLGVGIGAVRLHPTIEDTIIKRWSATWLNTAKEESKQIERRRNILVTSGQEKAIRQYADQLSHDLLQRNPSGFKETLKTLVMRTRALIINNDQLRQRLAEEHEVLEEIIKWMELNSS